jgi:hypothetical protein
MSRAAGRRLLSDRLFVAIVLVAHPGGLITEALHLAVSVTAFRHPADELGERV